MSHNVTYPQSIDRNPSAWQVREDDDDYNLNPSFQELIDRIADRLIRADALADILRSVENPPEHSTRITAMLLQDLIRETQEANEKLWDELHKLYQQVNDNKPTRH